MPDYSAGASRTVGTTYTAKTNGWLSLYGGGGGVGGTGSNGGFSVTVNGTQFDYSYTQGEAFTRIGFFTPFPAGTTYVGNLRGGANESLSMKWYPCIGG